MKLDKKWEYLDILTDAVKTKLKGDASLKMTVDDIMTLDLASGVSRATLERIFSKKRRIYPTRLTRDKLADYLGYNDYNEFTKQHAKKYLNKQKEEANAFLHSQEVNLKKDTAKQKISIQYAKKLIEALKSISFRLKEILEGRALFLLENAPKEDFTEHRYISTLYRFAAIPAWIRAIRKELVYLDLGNPAQNKEIDDALYRIRNTLADGKYLEQLIVKEVCEVWGVAFDEFDTEEREKLGISVENLVKQALHKGQVQKATDLELVAQNALLEEIVTLLFASSESVIVSQDKIAANQELAIKMLARKQAWLYFDWQDGLGDFMLEEIERASNRFEVMGYGTFEDFYWEGTKRTKRWIHRVEKLFKHLDMNEQECFDARIRHLKNVYLSLVHLLEVLVGVMQGDHTVHLDALKLLKEFGEGL